MYTNIVIMLLPRVFQSDDSYKIMMIHFRHKMISSNIMLDIVWMNTYERWSSRLFILEILDDFYEATQSIRF